MYTYSLKMTVPYTFVQSRYGDLGDTIHSFIHLFIFLLLLHPYLPLLYLLLPLFHLLHLLVIHLLLRRQSDHRRRLFPLGRRGGVLPCGRLPGRFGHRRFPFSLISHDL